MVYSTKESFFLDNHNNIIWQIKQNKHQCITVSFISSVNSPQLPDIWRVLKKASYCPIFRMKNNADCSILWASLETLIITMLGWKYACTKTKLQKLTLRYKSRKIHSFIMIYKLLLSFSSFFSLFIPLNTDII